MKKLVQDRMRELIELSISKWKGGDKKLAVRYISIVKKYAEKNKVKIPKEVKLKFCRKCLVPWIPNETVKIRLSRRGHYLIYTCLNCGYKRRIPYKKFKKGTNQ